MDLNELADRVIAGGQITRDEALAILRLPDAATYPLVAAAGRVRRHFHGNTMKVNYLVNLKSGKCPEDCFYCSQRLGSEADVLKYTWLSHDDALAAANAGIAAGAGRVCLVASGRGPSNRDVDRVGQIIRDLKKEHPNVEVCACLGILKEGQAERLAGSGADAYNHNLNTAQSHYDEICTTHDYADRRDTVQHAREHGLSACSGLIAGMGETDEQLVEVAFQLLDVGADSVPVNFLLPFDGTPLQGHTELTAHKCGSSQTRV
ncbi:biotin synthase BioB [uncultured Tessaracoccus sp.]|uniref:biotin synthase BioB n=1 Tax=uncultured Tessaracoccus sp. TaxID=905023 RepID=UPI0026189B17|nr:biotin synthase BioB [uncultured Tessaracoccus sp.]